MEYSLEYKIGQMVMVGFRGTDVNFNSPVIRAIQDYPLGNVWLTDSYQDYGSIKSPAQLKKLVEQIKTFAEQPLFISIDAEG